MRNSGLQSLPNCLVPHLLTLVAVLTLLFSIAMTSNARAGEATLSWSPTTTYTDGSTVTDLSGYKLHAGTSPGTYSRTENIGNLTSWTVSNLDEGVTYYFAVTSYNAVGQESGYSNEVSKNIPVSPATWTVTATSGTGGSVVPQGAATVSTATSGSTVITSVSVTQGGSLSFSVVPSAGYKIADVAVDGISVGAVAGYTFSNIAGNHTLTASFVAASSYTITATAGTGGSISPSGTVSVAEGATQTYTVTPGAGYSVADVKVDGVSVGAVTSYTLRAITASHAISASFAPNASHWVNVTTNKTTGLDGTPSYMTWSPVNADASGKVTKLRISIREFGSPTQIRIALYNGSKQKLTEASAVITSAGDKEIAVPAVAVTRGGTYYIAVQAASNLLYKFDCGATTGGFESANVYSKGLPRTLKTGWSSKLLTAGMLLE